jgi:hypothetical protein
VSRNGMRERYGMKWNRGMEYQCRKN